MDLKEIRKQFEDEKLLQQDTGDATYTIPGQSISIDYDDINSILVVL